MWLHTHVALARGHETVLEDEVGRCKTRIDVATDDTVMSHDVALDAFVQARSTFLHRRFGVVHTWQGRVVDLDQLERL